MSTQKLEVETKARHYVHRSMKPFTAGLSRIMDKATRQTSCLHAYTYNHVYI